MINLAVIFDSSEKGGGGFYQSISTAKLIKEIKENNIKKVFYSTSKETHEILKSKYNIDNELIKFSFIDKVLITLDEISIFSKILKKLKYRNPIHQISENKKIDLFYFLGPSNLVKLIKNSENSNFIINIWDINHRINTFFPEYKSIETYNLKEQIIEKSVRNSFKIIVNSQAALEDMINYYNCEKEKILIMPFRTPLPEVYKNKNKDYFNKIFKEFNFDESKNIFFYPAQFWAHKNHMYLFQSLKKLKYENNNFILVLTGDNKGNLRYIKNIIKESNLEINVKILNFLTEDQIISLYINSDALLMPTYVARTTLPLLEALYFELPIFYSKNILDKEYSKYVNEFDLNNPSELYEKLTIFLNKRNNFKDKTLAGREFYNKISDKESAQIKLETIFNEYNYLSSRWK